MRDQMIAPKDHQWDLTLEIASALWFRGECVLLVDPHPLQQLVDVRWAALQAGRLLGVRAKVEVSEPASARCPIVTATITFDDLDGRGRTRAQAGLEALLRSVRTQQQR